MDLVSKLEMRTKANNSFVNSLKRANRYETGLFKENDKVKKRFDIYMQKDKKLVKEVQSYDSASEKIWRKTIALLESETKLIMTYKLYKLKYRLPKN